MWRVYLGDTMSGRLAQRIDVPGFKWSVTVSDSTFTTGRDVDKGVGEDSAGGVDIPWTAVPADDPAERCQMLMPLKRSVCLMWDDGSRTWPVAWGAIGPRSDTYEATSFDLISAMELLDSRYLVREGVFGAVSGQTEGDDPQPGTFTRDTVRFEGMSLRGIASEVGSMCTEQKPGGFLPIDWTYLGETGGHERTYEGYDLGNNSGADIMRKISNVIDGPDIQFRPYMADAAHVRLRFTAGSDADVFIGQGAVHSFSFTPHGGNAESVTVDYANPVQRVYATGSGTDEGQLCHLSQDISLCQRSDPWPLMEEHYSDSDAESASVLKGHADAQLSCTKDALMQVSFEVHFDDPTVPPPGSIWPGEMVEFHVSGFPSLPDGMYRMRLMEMSGDDTDRAKLVCRPVKAPFD